MNPTGTRLSPEPLVSPATDGPFVEVAPGTWVRAAAVLSVEPYTDGGAGGAEPYAAVVVAGGAGDPVWWRSPYTPAQLRGALRRAALGEERRLLIAAARLAVAARRSADGGA